MPSPARYERKILAYTLRQRGLSIKEIATEFGVSAERARQLVNDGEYLARDSAENPSLYKLSGRAHTVASGLSRRTADNKLAMATEIAEMRPGEGWSVGIKTIDALREWVGLPPLRLVPERCPCCGAIIKKKPEQGV